MLSKNNPRGIIHHQSQNENHTRTPPLKSFPPLQKKKKKKRKKKKESKKYTSSSRPENLSPSSFPFHRHPLMGAAFYLEHSFATVHGIFDGLPLSKNRKILMDTPSRLVAHCPPLSRINTIVVLLHETAQA